MEVIHEAVPVARLIFEAAAGGMRHLELVTVARAGIILDPRSDLAALIVVVAGVNVEHGRGGVDPLLAGVEIRVIRARLVYLERNVRDEVERATELMLGVADEEVFRIRAGDGGFVRVAGAGVACAVAAADADGG